MGLLVNWHKWFKKKDEEPPVLQKDTEALPESFMGKGAEHLALMFRKSRRVIFAQPEICRIQYWICAAYCLGKR